MEEAGTSGVLTMAPFRFASSEFNKERSQIPQARFLNLRAHCTLTGFVRRLTFFIFFFLSYRGTPTRRDARWRCVRMS